MFSGVLSTLAGLVMTVVGTGSVAAGTVLSQTQVQIQANEMVVSRASCWLPWIDSAACSPDATNPGTTQQSSAPSLTVDLQNQIASIDQMLMALAERFETVTSLPKVTTTVFQPTRETIIERDSYLAGDGLTIENGTIRNTDRGTSQAILKTIEIAGSDKIVFSSNNDVLRLVAGNNISLSTTTATNTISISGTGSGGYNNLYEVGNLIGVGTASPAYTLDVNGTLAVATNSGIRLTANTPTTGSITRSISLIARTKYDRPWISSIDYTGRHAASFGVHHTNYADDDIHKRWELKTSADPNGSNPSALLTRFAIDYDTDIANVIFGDVGSIGTHNDYGQRAIFVHNMTTADGSQSINVGQWTSELGAGDSTVMSFDAKTLDGTKNATIRLFRDTNTSGQRKFVVLKGDGTATESFTIDASTGLITTFANAEGLRMGDGTNTSAYVNMQSNRTMVGYDGSFAVLQGGTNKGIKFNVNSSSFGAGTLMTLLPTGRVGISTTDPAALLAVGGNSEFQVDTTGNITAASASVSGGLSFSSAASIQTKASQSLTLGGNSTGNIVLLPQNGSGRVGIGTTNPSASLHIARNTETLRLGDDTNVSSYINVQSNRTLFGYDGSNAVFQGGTNKGIKLNVNSSSFGTGTAVTIDTNGNVGFGISPTLGPIHAANGAYLTAGGSWQNASDRNVKEGFSELDAQLILEKINQLPITEWSYIQEGLSVRHIGPTAQDFWQQFGLGNTDTSISTIDPAGVALVGIQGLSLNHQALESRVVQVESTAQAFSQQPGLQITDVDARIDHKFAQAGWHYSPENIAMKVAAVFESTVTFLQQVIFTGRVEFQQAPHFGQSTAGTAIIQSGTRQVAVQFDQQYDFTPQVTATPNLSVTKATSTEAFFAQHLEFIISDVSTQGFSIILAEPTQVDVGFSWVAIAVKQPVVSVSQPEPVESPEDSRQPTDTIPMHGETLKATDVQVPSSVIDTATSLNPVVISSPQDQSGLELESDIGTQSAIPTAPF